MLLVLHWVQLGGIESEKSLNHKELFGVIYFDTGEL